MIAIIMILITRAPWHSKQDGGSLKVVSNMKSHGLDLKQSPRDCVANNNNVVLGSTVLQT